MTAESEVLPQTGSDVVEYRQTEAALAMLREQLADATIDCTTTAGDKQARDSRLTLVRLRTALEDKRKELKAPHIEAGKRIDDEAKRITGAILELERPIDEAIKAEERRREQARQERERIERERKARNEGLIDGVKHLPLEYVSAPVSLIEPALADLIDQRFAVDDDYRDAMDTAHAAAIAKLREVLETRRDVERQQAELRAQREEQERQAAAERAELERLRAEEAERNRIAAEERRAADAAAEAERRRLAEEQEAAHRAERERIDQANRAEQERLAAERAELQRQREADEAARREEERKAAEKKAEAQRKAEAKAIEQATVHESAREVIAFVESIGHGGALCVRKLAAALDRASA